MDSRKILKNTVIVRGKTVHYKQIGKGKPLILLHGLSGSTRWWKRNILELSKHYTLFLIDLPGFGAMNRQALRSPIDESAMWLKEWMDAVGLSSSSIIGHSLGGYIALQLSILFPKKVNHLVLVAPAGVMGRSIIRSFIALVSAIRFLRPAFLPVLVFDAFFADPITMLKAMRGIIQKEIIQELHELKTKTLIVWGKNDTLVPRKHINALLQYLPHAKLYTINKAGHVPMFDTPEEFNREVLRFLQS